ncbi:MAG: pirin family protein [Desulfobacterales bacterium]|nr:pirin family protein [Desulfobacterales bacterium]
MKKVLGLYSAPRQHWVGDGFPVRSLFSYHSHGAHLSPFLLLDYAGPAQFAPSERARGVGAHPHRGFETVTIVYQGEVEHRDSDRQRRAHRPRRRAVDDGGPRHRARGVPLEGVQRQRRHAGNGAAVGQSAGPRQDVRAGLPDAARRRTSRPWRCRTAPARCASSPASSAASAGRRAPSPPIDVWDLRLNQDRATQFSLPEGRTAGADRAARHRAGERQPGRCAKRRWCCSIVPARRSRSRPTPTPPCCC